MRKPIALLFAAALVLGMAGMANAQQTYTWTLVEGEDVALLWPNEANSPNIFEADGGLLGRVLSDTDPTVANACELAPSFTCAAGNPPVFLLAEDSAEGPSGAGAGAECNRKVTGCNTAVVPGVTGHGGHDINSACTGALTPFACCSGAGTGTCTDDSVGEYSYLVIHTAAQGTNPAGKGIGFFAGTFVNTSSLYTCNDCAATGRGRDENVAGSLNAVITQTTIASESVSLWLTQSTTPFGHAQVSLVSGGAGTGSSSVCGNGIAFQDLHTDLCVDGLAPGTGNFTIPDQKVTFKIFSTDMTQMADFTNQGRCNPPDCYIQNVIVPAALSHDAGALNVQVQAASSVLPADAPGTLANATVDSLLFMYTTQALDMDEDTTEDRTDPCPNDPTNDCLNIFGGGPCPAGEVFCADALGDLTCVDSYLCNMRIDANQDCTVDSSDLNRVTGVDNGTGGSEAFGFGVPIGPFDP